MTDTTDKLPRAPEGDQQDPVTPRFSSLSAPAQARAQQAYERIAGDEGLTGDLTDDAARRLLAWAQREVIQLATATEGLDPDEADAAFASRLAALRQALRRIAGESADAASPDEAIHAFLVEAQRARDQNGPQDDAGPDR